MRKQFQSGGPGRSAGERLCGTARRALQIVGLAAAALPLAAQEPRTEPRSGAVLTDPGAMGRTLARELAAAGLELDVERVAFERRRAEKCAEDLDRALERRHGREWFEVAGTLRDVFRRASWKDDDLGVDRPGGAELRWHLSDRLATELLAYYAPERDVLVVLERELAEGVELGPFVLRELVHARRDQRSDLDALLRSASGSIEAANVASCLFEGEAELATAVVMLRRSGQDVGEALAELVADVALGGGASLPCDFGTRFQARAYLEGGWAAVDATWRAQPVSTEQLMHPEKLARDAPRRVALPEWPERAGSVELEYETTIGELGILEVLLDAEVDLLEAQVAALGWDGDLLRVHRTEEGDTLMFRSVWDREEDAEQFASAWKRATAGPVARDGCVVDWVHSASAQLSGILKRTLAASPAGIVPSAADARSTERAERVLHRAALAVVDDGRWSVPVHGISMPAPKGWESSDFEGIHELHGPQLEGEVDSIQVRLVPPLEAQDLEGWLEELDWILGTFGVVESSGIVELDGVRGTRHLIRTTRDGGSEVVESRVYLPVERELLSVIASVDRDRWAELEDELGRCFDGIRLSPARARHAASAAARLGPRSAERGRRLETVRLPVSRHAVPDEPEDVDARPVLNILSDGTLSAFHGDAIRLQLPLEETEDDPRELRLWLRYVAANMRREHVHGYGELPADELLFRVDQDAPFSCVLRVMENCGYKGIQIWRLCFAVAAAGEAGDPDSKLTGALEGLLRVPLPTTDEEIGEVVAGQTVEIVLRVKLGKDGERVLEYTIAGRTSDRIEHVQSFLQRIGKQERECRVVIEPRSGTTYGDVVRLIEVALDAGLEGISFKRGFG